MPMNLKYNVHMYNIKKKLFLAGLQINKLTLDSWGSLSDLG